jgi:hypothetical protein
MIDEERIVGAWTETFKRNVVECNALPLESESARPCAECPAGDMYLEIVEALIAEPTGLRYAAAARWFCHMQPHRRYRGVRDAIR